MKAKKVLPEQDQRIREEVAALAERFKTRADLTRETATLLFFRYGIYPSAQLTHGYTRFGSLTDISRDLEEFWTTVRENSRVRIEGTGLPDEVLAKTTEVLGSLWALAQTKATEGLDAHRAEADDKVEVARQAALQAEERLQQVERALQGAMAEARRANEAREDSERRLAVETSAKEDALRRALAAEAQNAQEVAARRDAETRFTTALEAEREARKRSEERLEGEVRFAKIQIDEARELARIHNERVKVLEADKTLTETTYKRQIGAQAQEIGALRLEVGEARGRHAALVDERDRLSREIETLRARVEENHVARSARLKEALRAGLQAQVVTMASTFELTELWEATLCFEDPQDGGGADLLYLAAPSEGGSQAITPKFSSLSELEAFVSEHMQRYEDLDVRDGMPERWFWEG